MNIPDWIISVVICGTIFGAVMMVGWFAGTILQDFLSLKNMDRFEDDLALAVINSQPTWEQILQISASRHVKHSDVYWVLQRFLREILTGRNRNLASYRNVIESYIAKMEESEPFEGMPNEIRIHLERLRERLPKTERDLLEPLTSQIRELLAANGKDQRVQKFMTVGGFVVGVLGFAFAGFTYFVPYHQLPAQMAQSGTGPSKK